MRMRAHPSQRETRLYLSADFIEETLLMRASCSWRYSIVAFGLSSLLVATPFDAQSPSVPPRHLRLDMAKAAGPVDRFFDLSVGSDYPGTLIRDDSQAQLKVVTDELGFRYVRFHAIFHDFLGTVEIENGKTVYDWSGIDRLYDDLLARHIRPFVELGFTPEALATSKTLTEQQVSQLSGLTRDLPEIDRNLRSGPAGTLEFAVPMNSNDIVLIKLTRNR
jgi:hypothetical protein